jgi:4-aminobutyrate aminotransferase/(S)-3-amino-2-methylpropionate transaminase
MIGAYEPYVEVCRRLAELSPCVGESQKSILVNSGAEAVENAVKIARHATGRPAVVVFDNAFHGRTLLTMSMTSKVMPYKKGFGPFAPEIYRLPAPNLYRAPDGMSAEQYVEWSVRQLENALVAQVDPSAVAAVIIEPVQGEAGFIPVPPRFLRRIRELCDQHGIVMIADEVQSGFGRTGRLFAIEHSGVAPDLVTTAKSLGAGMPISAVTGRAEIMDSAHLGGIGGTYGGNPVACAAALAAVEMIRQPAFLQRAERVGEIMREATEDWKRRFTLLGDARGLGAMRLVELVRDRKTKEPAPEETLAVIKHAVSRGLIVIRAGLYSNCVRLLPPLVITDEQLHEGLDVLGTAIGQAQP